MRAARLSTFVMVLAACGGANGPPASTPPAASTATVAAPAQKPEECSDDYRPRPASTAAKPDLPPVPELPQITKKIGDAFTVAGAVHALRSRFESADVTRAEITIVGFIVDSNVPRAPKCAWHKTGVADPPDCASEIPSFVIADSSDVKPDDAKQPHIRVLGWARNFAVVFDATQKYKGLKAPPKELVKDEVWNVDVPYPIPSKGAKVKVKGRYGFTFTKSSTGIVADERNGVFTLSSLEML